MKKGLKIAFAVLMTALITALSVSSVFAAKDTTEINGKVKAKSGDTVTYTLKLGDCTEKLEGIQMYVFYDKDYLSVDADSLKIPNLKGAVKNANYKDGIAFNWTSVTDLVDFSKTKTLMTVDFKVERSGKTDINYFITEMYGKDITYLKNFTLTYDLAVNGKTVVKDEVPPLSKDEELNSKYQGTFTNYSDGKGEKNGKGKTHVSVTGDHEKSTIADPSDATSVTKDGNQTNSIGTILMILGIIVAIIAIVILVILRNHFSKKPDKKEE